MRALFLFTVIASLNLRADAIGTPFTATTCTIGTQTQAEPSACNISVVIGQAEYEVSAHALGVSKRFAMDNPVRYVAGSAATPNCVEREVNGG